MGQLGKNLKYLRESMKPPLNQEAFGALFGLSRGNISSYEDERAEPKLDKLLEIAKYFSITIEDFATADLAKTFKPEKKGKDNGKVKGKEFGKSQNETYINPIEEPGNTYDIILPDQAEINRAKGKDIRVIPILIDNENNEDRIPLVHTKAAAGYVEHLEEREYISNLPRFSLPGREFKHGTFRGFEVEGESMVPDLQPGWIVIGQYVEDWLSIKDGLTFIIVPKFGRPVVKRILNRIKKRGALMLRSTNPATHTYPMYIEDVAEVWIMRAFIGFTLPQNDRQLAADVNNLMGDMAEMKEFIEEMKRKGII